MRSTPSRIAAGLAVLALAAATSAGAQTGDWPSKPVRILVPIAAGSVTDVVLRAAAPLVSAQLGQQLVVENRPGASGVIGAEACARATADGYTICATYHAIMSFNPHTFEKLPYDPARDFVPVTNLYFVTEALVVPRSLAPNTVAELRSFAAANPAALNFGTLGEGSLQELMVAWLNREWNAKVQGVPYKGGGPIAAAVTAGEIQMAQMGLGNFLGPIRAGQVKALALSAARRSPQLPDVPTLAEAGLGGFASRPWWGIVVPAGTPAPIVARLNATFVSVFRDPKFVEFLEGRYVEPAPGTAAEFASFLEADRKAAGELVRLAKRGKN